MPTISISNLEKSSEEGTISLYIPVHFDFSQIEYVAPFLEHYKGSKVFIYKWNGIREKIHKYYKESPEYKKSNLGVYDFTLKNIVKAIFEEPVDRKVVFLLTSSMAYAFGEYQRTLLNEIKSSFEKVANEYESDPHSSDELKAIAKVLKNKIWGVSVIGHCMYGCMSCKGNDHKVPVYFTRYFLKNIPYKKEDIEKQFSIKDKPISVLCAPSTGETSLLLQTGVLDYLLELQNEGHFNFVWKFHPSVYNKANYSSNTKDDELEMKNVKWIMKNFQCTKESEPCLLPFLEAFRIIFCDLHSSVPFIASYFSPKTIICYWNDADYEVPAGRDPAFLANLHVYQHLDQLKSMLFKDHIPEPRGDRSFFHRMYGQVDGHEVERYARLAQWEKKEGPQALLASSLLTTSFSFPMYVYRHVLSTIVSSWNQVHVMAQQKQASKPIFPPPDENDPEEVRMAIGLPSGIPLDSHGLLHPSPVQLKKAPIHLSVMTCNLWLGGEGCYASSKLAGQRFSMPSMHPSVSETTHLLTCLAKSILSANVDLVGCQECASLARDTLDHDAALALGKVEGRFNQLNQLQSILSELSNVPWYVHQPPILTPGRGNRHPWGILSKYPMKATPGEFGVLIEVYEHKVMVFNTHLSYYPYQPYQLLDPFISYEEAPPLTTEKEAIQSSLSSREVGMKALLSDLDASVNPEVTLVLVMGDFNEPSHLDWTGPSVIAGYHPKCVAWPMTEILTQLSFKDCYRTFFPDVVKYPGFTWCSYKEEFDTSLGDKEGTCIPGSGERDKMDRIDFIFYKSISDKCQVQQVEVMGNSHTHMGRSMVDDTLLQLPIKNEEWVSDHRAVIARFTFDAAPF
ncbi:hypothetical protein HMI54_004012 [Coelomomyces lativittatus]|nr:hypothetical protein HMI56_006463 [Coelomomyces lativittatus]KAJ1515959.1 hypothetical protein HMI55_003190 [Coelomomyces lativittatus]KAJ1517793.1 hypothetical protein HMI54_004012 [Coelomomyces lativittatus]